MSRTPSRRFVELSAQLLVRVSSASARDALDKGKLASLGAMVRCGIVWVQGRVRGEELARLLGTPDLPIVMATEALAASIMRKAHREDHRRSPQDIAARSRRLAWIPGATRLAKSVASHCYYCRASDKRMARQRMGSLPDERTTMLAPFEALALDLFGPYRVKDPAKGRRTFKCWVVAFVCLATKAACLLACPGYSTAVFLDVFHMFSGIYGQPRLVYTDHAPSLIKASETHDWGDITAVIGETGTEWRLTAKGCSLAKRTRREVDTSSAPYPIARVGARRAPGLPSVQHYAFSGLLNPQLSSLVGQDHARRGFHRHLPRKTSSWAGLAGPSRAWSVVWRISEGSRMTKTWPKWRTPRPGSSPNGGASGLRRCFRT